MRILWVFNHPAPYKVDFFNELGKSIDLDVVFERSGESGRNSLFYAEKPIAFKATVLDSLHLGAANNWTRGPVKAIKKGGYDLIVMNGWSTLSEMSAIKYLRRHKIPYIFYINGGIVRQKESPIRAHLKKTYIGGAAYYFAPDENSAAYLAHYGADPKKIAIFPYSTIYEKEILDHPYSEKQKASLRDHLHLPGSKVFVSCGQFIARQNFSRLIAGWKDEPADSTLFLIGDGPEKKKYERQIAQLGLTNVVIHDFVPHRDNLRLFRSADALIFLSKEDIYGHVTNEALSQGVPVISGRKANSAVHLIKDGFNGFLIDPDEDGALQKAIEGCLAAPLGENALATARENTIEKMSEFHLRKFEELSE